MAKFVLTAELAVRNQNLRPVISQLQKQLSNVKANVTLKLDPSTKGNLDNINKALTLMDSRLKSAAGAAVVLNQQISQLNKTLGGNLNKLGQITKTATNAQTAMSKTATAANQTASGMTRLGQQSSFAIKRIAAFSVATTAVIALTTAMKSGIQEAILFQNGLVKISQITGTSLKNLGGLTSEITRLSTTLGVSSQELLNVSDTLAQAGLSANEVTIALEALAKTKLAPTFGKIEDTVEGVIASMRQFNIEAKDLEATLGSFNSVAAAFAVESNDIVTAVRRSGAAFEAAGGSLEEFIALFTSVRQTTRESAETIATGFRTIFTRIQRPKTLNFLRDLGVELLDLQGRFVGPYEAVRRLSTALAEIPGNDPRFAQIIEELGGFRQVSKVIPLIQQFAVAEKALAVAQRGRGSLTRDAVTAQQSLLVQLTKLRERFFELFRTIGDSNSIKGFLQLGLKLADSFVTIGQTLTPLIPMFAVLAGLKLGSGLKNFSGGFFGGKGQTGAGKGTTAAATSTATNTISAATTNNANAIGSNTAAIIKLTSILQTLPSALSSRVSTGLGGYAPNNGPVRKFARGGMVPGVGNTDSVRANLMPGEFVMPKKSVEKFGVSNLVKLAQGGKISEKDAISGALTRQQQDFGLISLFPEGDRVEPAEKRTISRPQLSQEIKDLTGFGLPTDKESLKTVFPRGFAYNLHSGSLGADFANTFEDSIATQLSSVVDSQAEALARNLGATLAPNKVDVKKFNFEQISGNIFEAAVSSIDNPFVDKTASTDAFDYLGGINAKLATRVFGSPALASMPTDAKRTITPKTRAGVDSKVAQIIAANEVYTKLGSIDDITKSQLVKIQDGKTSKGTDIRQALRTQANKFGILKLPTVPNGVDSGEFHRGLAGKLLRGERFADGGQALGTDVVPAVLTPGEYVFDAPSAKRIGYGNLEKMRAQRFAKGGLVKKYGTGGKVASAGGGADFGKLAPLLFVLPQVASQFGGLSDEMSTLLTQFITMTSVASLTGKSLSGFAESTAKIDKIQTNNNKQQEKYGQIQKKLGEEYTATRDKVKEFNKTNGKRFQTLNDPANLTNTNRLAAKGSKTHIDRQNERNELLQERDSLQTDLQNKRDRLVKVNTNRQNRTAKNQRATSFARAGGIAGRIGGGIAGAGIVGGLAGDQFFSNPANKNIEAGKGTQADIKNAGVGGALSGAATGASIGALAGSFLGPFGTLIGAGVGGLIGAIKGYTDSTEEAAKKIKAVGVSKDFDTLDASLKRISNNKTLSSFDKAVIGGQISKTRSNILGATGEDRQEALAKGQGQLSGITTFADKLASSVKSIEEFKTASGGLGQSLIEQISLLSETPLVVVEEQFAKFIKAQQNTLQLQNKINDALSQVYADSRYISNIVRAFDDSANSLQKFVSKANSISNDFQNISFDTDMNEVLSRGLEANPADLNRVLSQLLGNSGQGITNRISASAEASRRLPDILRNAAAAGPLSDSDPESAVNGFKDAIDAASKDFPAEFKAIIDANLGKLLSDDSADSKFLQRVEKDAEKFASELTEGASNFIEALSNAAQVAKKNADALIGIIQQRNSIEQKGSDLAITAANTRSKALRQGRLVGTNQFNSDVSSKDAQTFFNQSQNIRLKGTGKDSSSSSSELADAIIAKRLEITDLQTQRNGTSVQSNDFQNLSSGIGQAESELQKLTSALSEQANSTEILTALQNELSIAENNRKAKLSLASGLAFGGREGREEFAKSAQNARAIATNPSKIGSAEQEGSALKFLDQIIETGAGDKQLASLGGKSANQVKQERLGAFVGAEDAAALINASNEEKAIQQQVVNAQLGMADAQQRIADNELAKLDTIDKTLISGFASMRASFESSIADAEAKRADSIAKKDNVTLKAAEGKIAKKAALNQNLATIGLRPDEAENLTKAEGDLKVLEAQRTQREKLERIPYRKQELNSAKPVSEQVQSSLNTDFSNLIPQKELQTEIDRIKAEVEAPVEYKTGNLVPDLTSTSTGALIGTNVAGVGGGLLGASIGATTSLKEETAFRAPTEAEKADRLQQERNKIAFKYAKTNSQYEKETLLPNVTRFGINENSANSYLGLPEAQRGTLSTQARELGTAKDSDLKEARDKAAADAAISANAATQTTVKQKVAGVQAGIAASGYSLPSFGDIFTPSNRSAKTADVSALPVAPAVQATPMSIQRSRPITPRYEKYGQSPAQQAKVKEANERRAGINTGFGGRQQGGNFFNMQDDITQKINTASTGLGTQILNNLENGAKSLSSVFESFAKMLPTSIELKGSFQPLQVNITGAEALAGMADILGPVVLAQVTDQLSKVIPGLKTLVGPGKLQKPNQGDK